jgi:hypothetical protein
MNKKHNKKKATTSILVSFFILILFALTYWINLQKVNTLTINGNKNYPKNLFYKVFDYSNYLSSIQEFYNKKANELEKNSNITNTVTQDIIIDQEKPNKNQQNQEQKVEESIIIYSSLTSTPGAISVYGKSKGIDIIFQGKKVNTSDEDFNFVASDSYTLELKGQQNKIKISISSPAYGTNKILSQLTLQINPINMTATIIGKINLLLPGEIKGSLFNISNSSSSSTILQKGYFATSVSLQEGVNQLTATGQWFTIKLDLPSIQVIVTK